MKIKIYFLALFFICIIGFVRAQTTITFSSKTDFDSGSSPISVLIKDLNGDGKPDLAVANQNSNSVSVFLNITNTGALTPSFSSKTDFITGSLPWAVVMGDLNSDGKPDLVVINNLSNSVSVFLNTTNAGASVAAFSTKTDFITGTSPISASIRDLNDDSKLDLVVVNQNSNSVSVFINKTSQGASAPSFSFSTDFITENSPNSVSIGDFNFDGKPDLAVTNQNSNSVSVFLNTTIKGASVPSFSSKTNFTTGSNPRSVSIGDLNGDGKPDLAVSNQNSNNISIFLNTTTSGALTPSFSSKTDFTTETQPFSVSINDMNGDGLSDLAVTNSLSNSVSVFPNETTIGASTPSFSPRTDFTTGSSPLSVAIGDLNNDGKPDLAVANSTTISSISVFLNTTNITGLDDANKLIPSDYVLKQNYPNPFNPSTIISFSILGESFVTLKIYDLLGKEVIQLVNRKLKTGNYNFSFNANNLTSGIYFYRLIATENKNIFTETKKMILLK